MLRSEFAAKLEMTMAYLIMHGVTFKNNAQPLSYKYTSYRYQ